MEIEQVFGMVLKRERLLKGLSQEQLSALSGYHTTDISRMERGLKRPSIRTIFRISKALDLLPSQIILLTEEELDKPQPEKAR